MIEGAQESLDAANGGAICNIVLLETDAGSVIVDTGSTARFGAALRAFADQRLGASRRSSTRTIIPITGWATRPSPTVP